MTDRPTFIPVARVEEPDAGVSRRAAMQTLVAAVGAGFALPSAAYAQHPIHAHLSHPETVALTQQRAAAAASALEFLDAHQARALEAIAEVIVPGSSAARVGPFLDQLLASATSSARWARSTWPPSRRTARSGPRSRPRSRTP